MRFLSLFLLILQVQQLPFDVPAALRAALGLPPETLSPASVDGVVIDSETKQPLAGATVLVQDRSASGAKMITVTGNDGRFAFRSVPPGQVMIEASRSGYVSEMAGPAVVAANVLPNALGPVNVPIVQELKPGQVLSDVLFVLTPGAVISGRLTDDRGEVVIGAVVQALKVTH
jgi:hypothetical protein